MKTRQQVKEEFEHAGASISQWAISNGYAPSLVYRVLTSDTLPKRGMSHDIAVRLGLKDGTTTDQTSAITNLNADVKEEVAK